MFDVVVGKCGVEAATLWAYLQEQEACKKYGKDGQILHTLEDLKALTGLESTFVWEMCLALLTNGFARCTHNGQYITAA